MKKETYLISEAEKLTGEKAHVLRYWEEELGLTIGRNSMGHRYYTAQNIRVFLTIKELKKKGLHLKAIRDRLQQPQELVPLPDEERTPDIPEIPADAPEIPPDEPIDTEKSVSADKPVAMDKPIAMDRPAAADRPAGASRSAPAEKSPEPAGTVPPDEPGSGEAPAAQDRQRQFYQILDRLIRQLAMQRRQEERSRRVDEAIRKRQQTRRETAATLEQKQSGRRKRREGKEDADA